MRLLGDVRGELDKGVVGGLRVVVSRDDDDVGYMVL